MIDEKQYYDTHYAEMDVQPIEVSQKMLTHNQFCGGLLFNVIKYHMRAGHKQGEPAAKDLAKRDHYLDWYVMARSYKPIRPELPAQPVDEEEKQTILSLIDYVANSMREERCHETD